MTSIERLLVIGIDGATWRVLGPLLETDGLPNIKAVMSEGAYGILESTLPPFTTPAWNSMLTGLRPHRIGVYNFLHWKEGSYEKAPYFDVVKRHPDLFDVAGRSGKKVISVNVPSIYRAGDVPGLCIAGFLYESDQDIFSPPPLREIVEERFGHYYVDMVDVDKSTGRVTDKFSHYAESLIDLTRKRSEVTKYLMTNYDWDLTFVVFTESDRLQHRLWSRKAVLARYFRELDKCIGDLVSACPEGTAVFILSDHGFGPQTHTFCINEWLASRGYLAVDQEAEQSTSRLSDVILRAGLYRIKDILPARLKAILQRQLFSFTRIEEAPILWEKTRAVGYSVCGEIFINRKGRFPQGVVSDEECALLSSEISERLAGDIEQELGKRPTILRKGDGIPDRPDFPDLLLLVDDVVPAIDTSLGHSALFYETVYGSHRSDGEFVISVPDVGPRGDLGKSTILDIAPTIFSLLGIKPPWDMDGKPIISGN